MKRLIEIISGKEKIRGTIYTPEQVLTTYPAILFIHGWNSSERRYGSRAQALVDLGYICITFNLRGHGESEGSLETLSRKDHLKDCIAVYDFLSRLTQVNSRNISIVGKSIGGYLASLLTSERKVKNLALIAPALYPDMQFDYPTKKLIVENTNIYRKYVSSYAENRALIALHNFKGDLLLVEFGKDEDVPRKTTQSYFHAIEDKTKLTHVIIPNADHNLTDEKINQEFIQGLAFWFSKREK